MSTLIVVGYDDLLRPWLAFALIGAAFVYTVLATTWLQSTPVPGSSGTRCAFPSSFPA